MEARRRILLFLIGLFAARVPAAEPAAKHRTYIDPAFAIDLPDGYLDPVEHAAGSSVSRGFRKPYPGSSLGTVILVSVQEMGPSFAKRLAAERAELTRETLEPVLAGIARNRAGYRQGEPIGVTISGHRGVRVAWSGTAQGVAFDGVVYCVLAGSRAYAIQVQDPSGLGNARLNEALQAVERMRLAR